MSALRLAVFLVLSLGVLGLGYGYVGWRLTLGMDRARRRKMAWALGFTAALILVSFFSRVAFVEHPVTDALAWVGFVALGFSSLLFTLVVIRDLIWLLGWGVHRLAARRAAAEPDRDRRRFLLQSLNAGKLTTSGLMLGYGLFEARELPDVVRVELPIADLPEELVGFRIAQITDLHVGPTIKEDYVREVVARVNELAPDLVALTGDLVDGSVAFLTADVSPLAELKSTYGSYVCTGNHEYYAGVYEWVAKLTQLGMTVLLNEHRLLEIGGRRLLVAGVTDYLAESMVPEHASSPEKALAGAPPADVKLLLAHQPRSIFAASAAGFDVQLSGHTHGGQFFPWNFFAGLAQPYVAGLHRHDGTLIYVSRGTGYWGPPIRILAPSEITLLELVRA